MKTMFAHLIRHRPRPSADPALGPGSFRRIAFQDGARDLVTWAGRRLWLAVRTVIRVVRMAHHEQVYAWECILLVVGHPDHADHRPDRQPKAPAGPGHQVPGAILECDPPE